MANLFPVALRLDGKPCVVVGGGTVGTRKALALLECGANVTVISPQVSEKLEQEAASGRCQVLREFFSPEQLNGVFLVIAATDNSTVNTQVATAARERNVLLNLAADTNDEFSGDFDTMATVRQGDLLLAVTTGGAGPALSARLRRELETLFPPAWSGYIILLKEMRELAKSQISDGTQRATALRQLADDPTVFQQIIAGNLPNARERAIEILTSFGKDKDGDSFEIRRAE